MNSILRLRSPRHLRWGSSSSGFASAANNTTKTWASPPSSPEFAAQDEAQEEVTSVEPDVQFEPEPPVEVLVGTKSFVFPPSRGLRPTRPVQLGRNYRVPRLPIHIPPKHLRQRSWKPLELKQKHFADESPKSVLRRVRKELERRRDLDRAAAAASAFDEESMSWDDDYPVQRWEQLAAEENNPNDHDGWDDVAALEVHPTPAGPRTGPTAAAAPPPTTPTNNNSSSNASASPTRDAAAFMWENKPAGQKSPIRSPFRGFFTTRRVQSDDNSKSSEFVPIGGDGPITALYSSGSSTSSHGGQYPQYNPHPEQHLKMEQQIHLERKTMVEFHNSHENPQEMVNIKIELSYEESRQQNGFASASAASGDDDGDDDLP